MPISIVQLGSPRSPGEGLRIGTVRRPPRGVPKERFARDDYYDVWLPMLAPSEALLHTGRDAVTPGQWKRFEQRFRAELNRPDPSRLLDVLAALSHSASFSVGCYCEDASRCHRSILQALLLERNASLITPPAAPPSDPAQRPAEPGPSTPRRRPR